MCFYAMMKFLNRLNHEDESNVEISFYWSLFVEELLNGYMLA